jgi:ABC-type Na+ efflux pump permease subunit
MKKAILSRGVLFYALSVVIFSSCSTMKKSISSEKHTAEVKVSKAVDSVTVKRSDSATVKIDTSKTISNSDASFDNKTVIEEEITVVNDTTKHIKRTITSTTKGQSKSTTETQNKKSESKTASATDSTTKKETIAIQAKETSKISKKEVKRSVTPVVVFFWFVVSLVCFYYLNRMIPIVAFIRKLFNKNKSTP